MAPRMVFEQELRQLKTKMVEMSDHVKVSYDRLICAIKSRDCKALVQLTGNDRQLMEMQRGIEAECLMLLTREQPVAGDLRLVSAVLKVVTDMGRIGDHVEDIARLYLRIYTIGSNDSEEGKEQFLLEEMTAEAKSMLHESVMAFVTGSREAAGEVIKQDDVVDALFNQVKERMLEDIRKQSLDADLAVDYLMIAKYLEKIGDHAVNIAEWTIFRLTGDMQGVKLY